MKYKTLLIFFYVVINTLLLISHGFSQEVAFVNVVTQTKFTTGVECRCSFRFVGIRYDCQLTEISSFLIVGAGGINIGCNQDELCLKEVRVLAEEAFANSEFSFLHEGWNDLRTPEMIAAGCGTPDCSEAAIADQSTGDGCSATISGLDVTGVKLNNPFATITVSPTTLLLGDNTVTVTASDGKGSMCSKVINVRVVDDTAPEFFACERNPIATAEPGELSAIVEYRPPSATDNCDEDVDVVCTPPSGSRFPVGDTEVTCIATDNAGNTDQCSFIVTVLGPIIVNRPPDCSGAAIADQIAGLNCQATITGADVTGVTDPDGDPVAIAVSPQVLSLGANTVTVTASDGNVGEGGMCSTEITVNVVDNIDPVIACPPDISVKNDPGKCSAVVNFTATASDNCDVEVVCTPPSGSTYPVGETTVNCTATDDAGNQEQCSFKVTVEDKEAPVVTADLRLQNLKENRPGDRGRGEFEVVCAATDNCSATASAFMQIPPGFDNPQVEIEFEFEEGPESAINFRKNKKGKLSVALEGADEATLRAKLADILALGGVTVTNGQLLELRFREKEKKGEKFDFKFVNGTLVQEKVEGDDPQSTMVCKGEDASGNSTNVAVIADFSQPVTAAKLSGTKWAAPEETSFAPVPDGFSLEQNYPNPFNPETEIRFQLPEASQVVVKIFNTLGEEVRTLADSRYQAGFHSLRWDGKDNNGIPVTSTVYLYQLQAGSFSQVRKMSLLR